MKIVLIRLDKIGDLIATLPVDHVSFLNMSESRWVIAKGLGLIAQIADPFRRHYELDLTKSWDAFWELYRYLKTERPDIVVIFRAPWWTSVAAWLARVPIRVGRLSQWHSFLFFNKSLRQSRSRAKRHEAEYNMDLLAYALGKKPGSVKPPFLRLEPPQSRHLFEKFNITSNQYYVVHPGMAGSALNWPQSSYNALIEKLVEAGKTVVITGTSADERFFNEIKPQWQNHPQVRWLEDQLTLVELVFLLKNAKAVVAPSTGVVHLAASCGIRTIGLYSSVRAHSAKRWGPRGPNVLILSPPEDDPRMELVPVEEVVKGLYL